MSFVEANSLSSLTQLASNPPKYPRNPTEQKREPLVLYIERVPGSRDIILTPLKPSRKNVTAEDVASSLYFLHYQTVEDEILLKTLQKSPEAITNTFEAHQPLPSVTRKPLTQVPQTGPLLSSESTPRLSSDALGRAARKPLPAVPLIPPSSSTVSLAYDDENRPPLPKRPSVKRRPLGPREPTSPLPRSSDFQQPLLSSAPNFGQSLSLESATTPSILPAQPTLHKSPNSFALTLIRRDPSSGAQWNIGELLSSHVERTQCSASGRTSPNKQPKPDILINLSTPGYSQFRGNQAPTSYNPRVSVDLPSKTAPPVSNSSFTRTVSTSASHEPSIWPAAKHNIRTSSDLSTRAALNTSDPSISYSSSRNHYSFTSPWHGHCTFSTGTSGRSLKCRHVLPTYSSSDEPSNQGRDRPEAVLISELRFNLPMAEITGATPRTFGLDKIGLGKHTRGKLSVSTTEEEGEEDDAIDEAPDGKGARLDLSLGQEKAGGGNRGKRAKLGKLIIHDEGLKMLDLVVAANLGVWWETWGR